MSNKSEYAKIAWTTINTDLPENIKLGIIIHLVIPYSEQDPPKMVSAKALEAMNENNLDSKNLRWKDRWKGGAVKYEDGRKPKSKLLLEHTTPKTAFSREILKCKSEKEIIKLMENEFSGCCWITREEDDLLTTKGYRSRRPGGWKKCYTDCGISVVELA